VGAANTEFPHSVVSLIGRFKGETGEQYHLLPMARVTKSGIEAGKWVDRLCHSLVRRSRLNGLV